MEGLRQGSGSDGSVGTPREALEALVMELSSYSGLGAGGIVGDHVAAEELEKTGV